MIPAENQDSYLLALQSISNTPRKVSVDGDKVEIVSQVSQSSLPDSVKVV